LSWSADQSSTVAGTRAAAAAEETAAVTKRASKRPWKSFFVFFCVSLCQQDSFISRSCACKHVTKERKKKKKQSPKKEKNSQTLSLTLTSGPKIAPSAAGAGCGTQKTAKWRLRRLGMSFLPSHGVCIAAM
jgi:hypothetical protein